MQWLDGRDARLCISRSYTSTTTPVELFPQSLPAFEVLMVKLRSFQRKLCWLAHKASFEHERQGVAKIHRLQFRPARLFKRFGVRTVTRHAIVEAGTARHEAFCLSVIFAVD